MLGAAASAGLPWLVAKGVATTAERTVGRQELLRFAVAASLLESAFGLAVVLPLAATYAPIGVLLGIAATTTCLFVASVGVGFLQGEGRFVKLALINVGEVLVKLGFGLALAVTTRRASGAIAGSALGAAGWAVAGLVIIRRDLRLPRLRAAVGVWRQLVGIGSIQVLVAAQMSIDIVVGSVAHTDSTQFAGYLAMLVFARIPIFASGALSLVVYPQISASDQEPQKMAGYALQAYSVVALGVAGAVSTMPRSFLAEILPGSYANSARLLLPLAIAGAAAGLINLLSTFIQARSIFRPGVIVLSATLIGSIPLEAFNAGSVSSLAWSSATANSIAAATLFLFVRRRDIRIPDRAAGTLAATLCALVYDPLMHALHPSLSLWAVAVTTFLAVIAVILFLCASRWMRPRPPPRHSVRSSWNRSVFTGVEPENRSMTKAPG